MADDEIAAKITLDETQFTATVGKVISQLDALQASVASVGIKLEDSLGKKLEGIGGKLDGINLDKVSTKLAAGAIAMQEALTNVVSPAIDFEAAMRNVNTVAKLSEPELAALSEQMRTLGKEIGIGIAPTEAAAAQYDILSAGFTNTADATAVLTQAAIAAKGGMTTTAAAADVLTSALNAYGVGADQAKHFNDVLFTGVEKGKLTFEDFVQGLGQVVPAAAANNVSIEEISSAMAALTAAGQQPARAFTGLNAAIVQLSSPTEEAKKAAAGLGINLEGAAFKSLSFVEKLQLLAQTAGENKSALRKVLGDVNALGVAYSLAGNGAKTYAEAMAASTGPSDAAAHAAKENEKSVKASQEAFNAAAEAFKISLSTAILPVLGGLADAGRVTIEFLDSFSPTAKAAAGGALLLTTAVVSATAAALGFVVSAKAVAVSLGVEIPAGSSAAGVALNALSVRIAAARTAMGGLTGAALAGPAALAALGVGLALAANEYAKMTTAAAEAADAVETVGAKALKGTQTTVSTGTILGSSVGDLKKQGVTQADVQNRIRELRETLEDARSAGDAKTAALLQGKIEKLIAIREQLDQPTAAEKAAKGSDAVKNFKLDKVHDAAAEKAALKDQHQQALFEIETSKLVGAERIKALESLIQKEGLVGEERRSIERKIFEIRQSLEKDAASKAKKIADDQKQDALQAIDLSKASHQQKIAQLQVLAAKYKEDADFRRRIIGEIAREEQAAAKDTEEKKKKQVEDDKKAQELAKEKTSEQRGARQDAIGLRQDAIGTELDKAKAKGQTATIQALLQERLKLTEETIRLQLAEQLAQTKSAEAKVQLEKNAEERIRQERQKTAEEAKKVTDQILEDKKRLNPKKATSTEFTGQTLTVEELSKQMADRFGGGAGNADFTGRQQGTEATRQQQIAAGIAANIAEAQRKGIDLSRALGTSRTSLSAVTAGLPGKVNNITQPAPTQKFELEHKISVTLTREDGSTSTQRVTVSGVPGPGEGGSSSVNFGNRGRA